MESKTKAIIDHILGQIDSGAIGKGAKVPSEYMLAELFGVNKSTANKAVAMLVEQGVLKRLRGKGGTIVEKSSLFPRGRLAVVMRQTFCSFYRKALEGMQSSAFGRGYSCELFMPQESLGETAFWQIVHESGAAGIIAIGVEALEGRRPIPTIAVDYLPSSPAANRVVSCNCEGGSQLAAHLLARGHREIVFLTTEQVPHHEERRKGFMEELAKQGVSGVAGRSFQCSAFAADANVMIREIRERLPQTSTIAFSSDIAAYQTSIQLLSEGVKIPAEISIAGFGALREYRTPGFTIDSVEQNPFRLGAVAADGLIDIIEGKRGTCVERLPVKVVPGNTVATIRRA